MIPDTLHRKHQPEGDGRGDWYFLQCGGIQAGDVVFIYIPNQLQSLSIRQPPHRRGLYKTLIYACQVEYMILPAFIPSMILN